LSDEGRSLFEWFGKRREDSVMKGLRFHSLSVMDAVTELDRAIIAVSRGDSDTAIGALARLMLSEKEADNLEERISEELSKGDLNPREREDLLHLVRRMDYVADWAKDAGQHIRLIIDTGIEIPADIWGATRTISKELEKATRMLRKSIENLGVDRDEAVRNERGVEAQEHIIDELYFETKRHILFSNMDIRGMLLMKDILHAMEMSSDSCKDSADMIHIILVSRVR
jgi:predicted phosphate transport protein (TIGR00153 family)